LTVRERGKAVGMQEAKSAISTDGSTVAVTRVPPMRRLLSPVTAGVGAARHVLWYLSYHSGASRHPR
jgi:hypothetical protein